jgi:hypothetical protein
MQCKYAIETVMQWFPNNLQISKKELKKNFMKNLRLGQ